MGLELLALLICVLWLYIKPLIPEVFDGWSQVLNFALGIFLLGCILVIATRTIQNIYS